MNDETKDALEEVRSCAGYGSDPTTWALKQLLAPRLADELRTLRAALDEERVKRQEWQVTAHGFEARVAELEASAVTLSRYRDGREAYWLERQTKWIAEHDRYAESCKWHADRAEKAEAQVAEAHERLDEFGIRRDGESATLVEGIAAMRERIDEYRAEWYRAEAQVAAARAECASIIKYTEDDGRHSAATDILEAMDEAAK